MNTAFDIKSSINRIDDEHGERAAAYALQEAIHHAMMRNASVAQAAQDMTEEEFCAKVGPGVERLLKQLRDA